MGAAEMTPPKRTEPSASSSAASPAQPVAPEASLYTPPLTESAVPPSHQETSPSEETSAPERREPPAADDTSDDVDSEELASAVRDDSKREAQREDASDEYDAGDHETGDRELGYADENDDFYYAVKHDEAALEAAFLETPEPVEEASLSAPMQERDEAPLSASPQVSPQDDDRAHYIDYHPPSLTSEASADEEGAESHAGASRTQEGSMARSGRVPEEEWEIEEVAFEPRRRDNSEPSKLSK
jgi:pilus assembly protein FimV